MSAIKKILISIACMIVLMSNFIYPVKAAEAFTIDQYHISLNVHEDGVIEVTETVHVNFDYRRHGIYFEIASTYEMSWDMDGNSKLKDYSFPISDIKVLSSHSKDIEYQTEGVVIRLGDEDYYANQQETYIVSYKMHTKDLDLDGIQMLYYNLIGRWDTTIENFSFDIQMPKAFDESKLLFSVGNSASNLGDLSYSVEGNKVTGSYSGIIDNNESVTVNLMLDENYFKFPDYSYVAFILAGIGSFLTIMMAIIFLKNGRDNQLIIPVEFSIPEGVSSAEAGYIIDGSIENHDLVSLILDWARKGYLNIIDDKSGLTFEKIKEMDKGMPTYEIHLFRKLFENRTEVKTGDLKESFYTAMMQCKQELSAYMNKKENRIFSYSSIFYRVISYLITVMIPFLFIGITYYFIEFNMIGFAIGLLPLIILIPIHIVLAVLESHHYALKNTEKGLWYFLSLFLMALFVIIMLGYSMFVGVQMLGTIIVIIATLILCLISKSMIKRTPRGDKMLGSVLGLKQFIMVAEYDRLKVMVEEDPQIFYHVLPYAYAFGLTEIWADHFKDLFIPEVSWYTSTTPMMGPIRMYHLTRALSHTQSAMISMPRVQASRGGGSFGGGGFGGGGGFSGGGFGGSGGGSW